MLQAIRDKATGFVAMFIIGLIIIVFAFWGIESWLGEPPLPTVAKINGTVITKQSFLNDFQNTKLRQYMAKHGAPDFKKTVELKKQFLTEKVNNEIRYQAAAEQGYYYSQPQIENDIIRSRGYDKNIYLSRLSQNGITHSGFLALQQKRIYGYQFNYAFGGTEFFTPDELKENWKMQHRKLEISYLKIPASSYHKEITLNDKMLLDYYNKNKKRFMIPAKAKFAYLQLNYSDFIKKVKVTDNQLTKHFKQYKNTFREPTVRKASHILVKVAKNASAKKVAAAQKKINDAYNRLDALQKLRSPGDPPIKSGGVFKKLVKSHSDDKFVAGYVVDPVKQKALYTALNKVPVGLNSKPVRGKKGFYILLLTSSKPGKLQTFDAVKSTIRSKLLRIEALKLYSKKVDVLTTQVFENSETLDVAATTLKLEIKTTDWVQKKDKFKGVLALSQVRDEAFSKDVYASGSSDDSVNSRSIKINNGKPDARTIVIRLKEYQNSKLKTFEQVKPEVMKLVQAEVAASKAKQQGLSLLKQLKANSTLQALAKGKSWVVTKPEMIDRFNDKHPKPLVKKAFALGVPKKGGKYVNGVQLNNGDYIIFRLGKSEYGSMDKVNVQTRKIYSQGNAAMYSQVLLQNTLDLLRKEANVTLKPYLVLSNTNEN